MAYESNVTIKKFFRHCACSFFLNEYRSEVQTSPKCSKFKFQNFVARTNVTDNHFSFRGFNFCTKNFTQKLTRHGKFNRGQKSSAVAFYVLLPRGYHGKKNVVRAT